VGGDAGNLLPVALVMPDSICNKADAARPMATIVPGVRASLVHKKLTV
jgi:hypothetical protein